MTRPTGSARELEIRRKVGVRLLEHGHGVREVADMVGVEPGSVSRWKQTYEAEGYRALAATPHTGRGRALTEEQMAALEGQLSDGPVSSGFEADQWTLDLVVEVINHGFDVDVSRTTAWRYLQELPDVGQSGP